MKTLPMAASAGFALRTCMIVGATCGLVSNVPAADVCTPAPAGMVSWLPAEGNANDIIGPNDGSTQFDVTFAAGMVGQAFSFSAACCGGSIIVPNVAGLNITGDITIDAWVRPTVLNAGPQQIVSKRAGTSSGDPDVTYELYLRNNGFLTFFSRNSGTDHEISSGVQLTVNTWTHVAVTISGSTLTFYVNGVAGSPLSYPFTRPSTGNFVTIGSWRLTSGENALWIGQLDEIEIFNRALTATEVAGIANAGSFGKCPPPPCTPPPANMVAWYPAEDNTHDLIAGNNGTLTGGATYATGKVVSAFSLNGTAAFVQAPNTAAIDVTTAGTLDAWVQLNQLPSAAGHTMTIMDESFPTGDSILRLEALTDDKFYIAVGTGTSVGSTTIAQTGDWYHVAGTFGAGGLKIYVNGVLENTVAGAIGRNPSGTPLRIGQANSGFGARFFSGLIDEPEIFDRALGDTEIAGIAGADKAGKCHDCTPAPPDMVSWWRAERNAGDFRGTNNGTEAFALTYVRGKVGQAFNLNGFDHFVQLGSPTNMQVQNFTIDAWIKRGSATTISLNQDGHFTGSTPEGGIILNYSPGGYTFGLKDNGTLFFAKGRSVDAGTVSPAGLSVTDTNFHHLAVTKNGTTVTFYVDGVGVVAPPFNETFTFAGSAVIGAGNIFVPCNFLGRIDELEFFNRALTATEMSAIADAGNTGKCLSAPTPTPPPVIRSPLAASGTVGQQFTYQFEASGATSLGVSSLPPGLAFNTALAAIVGNPTAAGTFQVGLSATNASGTTTATLNITVQPAPSAEPVIVSGTSATGRVGRPFSLQVASTGGSPAARVSANTLPAGLNLDAITGLISGTATSEGSSSVTLTVTDGGLTTTSTLQLTFTADPVLPVIVSPSTAALAPGQAFSYTINAPTTSNPATDPTTYTLVGTLPQGLTFDSKTGIISGVFTGTPFRDAPRPEWQTLSGGIVTNVQLFATNSRGTSTIPLLFTLAPTGAVNISTRIAVGTADNVLIGGFIITGNAPKQVIIRAIAPSLKVNGAPLPGALANPILELYDNNGLLGLNDDWRESQEEEIVGTGIPPADEHESSIIATIIPGNYTAILRGQDNTTGIAVVEVYDLGTSGFDSASKATLAQISTRGTVQSDDNVMIGGFIISGVPTRVLVRAPCKIRPSSCEIVQAR